MTHAIEVPDRLQRPVCACGWAAPYPFRVSWDEFDRLAAEHMAGLLDCATHGVQDLNAEGRCPLCRNQGRTHG